MIFVTESTQAFYPFLYDCVVRLILALVSMLQRRTASYVQGRMRFLQCLDGAHYIVVVMMPLPLNRQGLPILAIHALIRCARLAAKISQVR